MLVNEIQNGIVIGLCGGPRMDPDYRLATPGELADVQKHLAEIAEWVRALHSKRLAAQLPAA